MPKQKSIDHRHLRSPAGDTSMSSRRGHCFSAKATPSALMERPRLERWSWSRLRVKHSQQPSCCRQVVGVMKRSWKQTVEFEHKLPTRRVFIAFGSDSDLICRWRRIRSLTASTPSQPCRRPPLLCSRQRIPKDTFCFVRCVGSVNLKPLKAASRAELFPCEAMCYFVLF